MSDFPGYPSRLADTTVGQSFEMYLYEGVYMRVRLPEGYRLASNRRPLTDLNDPTNLTITPDGDGHHLPVVGADGRVFLMSGAKPVRFV